MPNFFTKMPNLLGREQMPNFFTKMPNLLSRVGITVIVIIGIKQAK
jgi:hypothetical protein